MEDTDWYVETKAFWVAEELKFRDRTASLADIQHPI